MPGLDAANAFPKVVYDELTDILYIALSRVRTGYVRADRDMPDIHLCFSDFDDELFGIHVSRFSEQNPELLRQRVSSIIDLPLTTPPTRRLSTI
ncbi:MAG: DUF2283 domain-containing protein [Bacillota bacterium]